MPKKKPSTKRQARKSAVRRSAQEQRRARLARRRILFSILVLLVVAAIVFFLVLRKSSEISIAENGIGSLFSRVQIVFTNATNGVRRFTQRWRDFDRLQAAYDDMALENQRLSLQLNSAQEAIRENERLQSALEAKSRYEALDPIFARVIAREPGQWFETFSINRGNSDGVAAGMSVVNGDGLIGRVYEVGMNYAKVICIVDSRSAVACMVQSTRDNGIMRGRISSSSDDAACYVYYLPNLNSIMPGDTVITSGTDSLFPKGLHIGTITAVSMDAGSEGSYAVVTPSVDFRHLEEVFVLREVIETDSDEALPVVNAARSASPSATPGPNATPTPSPTPAEETWSYPSADATAQILETLPEDEWAREQ
ncbi:MAG: rod shape-determining protein MreC [Clostridia bacterium]|nr:rod shape-determining protein MreC [Clostridia bacterium]